MDDAGVNTVRRVHAAERELVSRLADAEPVHPVDGPGDLARRLAPDRRLFGLQGPGDGPPSTVVWVALTRGVPSRIGQVVGAGLPVLDPADADTAVFYSIWNVDPDAPGPGRGRELIEGAAELLADELAGLATFVTLSPVPGLAELWHQGLPAPGAPGFAAAVARVLVTPGDDGRLSEPVARFHLGNGARLWRVNVDGDLSPASRDRSLGVMVNYRYAPEDRAANRDELAAGFTPVSAEVAELLAQP